MLHPLSYSSVMPSGVVRNILNITKKDNYVGKMFDCIFVITRQMVANLLIYFIQPKYVKLVGFQCFKCNLAPTSSRGRARPACENLESPSRLEQQQHSSHQLEVCSGHMMMLWIYYSTCPSWVCTAGLLTVSATLSRLVHAAAIFFFLFLSSVEGSRDYIFKRFESVNTQL